MDDLASGESTPPQKAAFVSRLDDVVESHAPPPPSKRIRSSQAFEAQTAELLLRAVEGEIIPRLMLAHHRLPAQAARASCLLPKPTPGEVADLTDLLLRGDVAQSFAFVDVLLDRGMLRESLYLDLLSPAARLLGEMWESDDCNFVEVTIALGRLHQVLRVLSDSSRGDESSPAKNLKVLLSCPAGDQHSFGMRMVGEFFRLAGWGVWCGEECIGPNLAKLVRSEWFDAVGFSVGCECLLDNLTSCIGDVRSASLNQRIVVLVGGAIFNNHPELVAKIGADGSAPDAQGAVVEAERLVGLE